MQKANQEIATDAQRAPSILVARFMKIINERIKVTKNGRPCSITKLNIGPRPELHVHFISTKDKLRDQKDLIEGEPQPSSSVDPGERSLSVGSSSDAVQPPEALLNTKRKWEEP